ncbi:hypothetical protein M446_7050 (plasmid) [Methylobacterium sp. 4-46]|nr:hypothetical protein M446_7050 [Methylobacterium sp. 4-46]
MLPKEQADKHDYISFSDRQELRTLTHEAPNILNTQEAMIYLFTKKIERRRKIDKFRSGQHVETSRYWHPWQKPAPCLDIDNFICALMDGDLYINEGRKRNIIKLTIISKEELRNIGHKNGDFIEYVCPFEYIRISLSRAVGLAYDDLAAARYNKNNKSVLNDLVDLQSSLGLSLRSAETALQIMQKSKNFGPKDLYLDKVKLFGRGIERRNDKYYLTECVRLLCEMLEKVDNDITSMIKPGRGEHTWWVSFVISCGIMWNTLTGRKPTNSDIFERFVKSASRSLGSHKENFDSQIKTALRKEETLPDWCRFDSEIKGVLPSGSNPVRFLTCEEFNLKLNRWKLNIISILEREAAGDESASQEFHLRYHMALDKDKLEMRKIYEEFHFNKKASLDI